MTRDEVIQKLTAAANDPMWASHSEVSKQLLRDVLRQMRLDKADIDRRNFELRQQYDSYMAEKRKNGDEVPPWYTFEYYKESMDMVADNLMRAEEKTRTSLKIIT